MNIGKYIHICNEIFQDFFIEKILLILNVCCHTIALSIVEKKTYYELS